MSTKLLLAAVTALQLLQVAVANAESDRIEPDLAYDDSSYCHFPHACDQSTPGTGHKFFTGNLTEDLITVERCYSFCFKNVRQYKFVKFTLFMLYIILSIYYSSSALAMGVLHTSPTSLQPTHVAPTTIT